MSTRVSCTVYPEDSSSAKINRINPPIIYDSLDCNRCISFHEIHSNISQFESSHGQFIPQMVDELVAKKSHLTVLAGAPTLHLSKHFVAKLMSPLVDQIIRTLDNQNDSNQSVVKLSWYRINCNPDENLIDILQEYSFLCETSCNSANKYSLVMRECGGGRGIVVPGLWEVDMTCGNDLIELYSNIISVCEQALHNDGLAHTVMTLTFEIVDKSYNSASISSFIDPPSTCRSTFLFLSEISLSPISSYRTTTFSNQEFHWKIQLSNILNILSYSSISATYSKSRLCLLLRDALLGNQPSCFHFFIDDVNSISITNEQFYENEEEKCYQSYLKTHYQQWWDLIEQIALRIMQSNPIAIINSDTGTDAGNYLIPNYSDYQSNIEYININKEDETDDMESKSEENDNKYDQTIFDYSDYFGNSENNDIKPAPSESRLTDDVNIVENVVDNTINDDVELNNENEFTFTLSPSIAGTPPSQYSTSTQNYIYDGFYSNRNQSQTSIIKNENNHNETHFQSDAYSDSNDENIQIDLLNQSFESSYSQKSNIKQSLKLQNLYNTDDYFYQTPAYVNNNSYDDDSPTPVYDENELPPGTPDIFVRHDNATRKALGFQELLMTSIRNHRHTSRIRSNSSSSSSVYNDTKAVVNSHEELRDELLAKHKLKQQLAVNEEQSKEIKNLNDALVKSDSDNKKLQQKFNESNKKNRILEVYYKRLAQQLDKSRQSVKNSKNQNADNIQNVIIDPILHYKENKENKLLIKQNKDLLYYKEVMEVSYKKLQSEKLELIQKNNDYTQEKSTLEASIRKLRHLLNKAKTELNQIKPIYQNYEIQIKSLENDLKILKKEKNMAIQYLGKGESEKYWRDKYSLPI